MLAHGWQKVPERGITRSHEPFEFWWAPTISGMAEATVPVVKFCTGRLYQLLAYSRQTNLERGLVRVTSVIFSFDARNHISGTAEARIVNFYSENISSVGLGMINYPQWAW